MHIDSDSDPDEVRKHYLYLIKNKVNRKGYIGATKSRSRWSSHKRGSLDIQNNVPLYIAMREYGVENFEFEVLLVNLTEKNAFDAESVYIKKYDTLCPNGYNLSSGGKGAPGVVRGPETRKLMSAAAKITSAKEPIKGDHPTVDTKSPRRLAYLRFQRRAQWQREPNQKSRQKGKAQHPRQQPIRCGWLDSLDGCWRS